MIEYGLWIVGIIVGLYIVVTAIVGLWKGWDAVKTIWHWTKKIGLLVAVLIGLLITAFASSKKNKKTKALDEKIAEIKAIENKTEEDLRKIKELEKEKKKAEEEIVSIAEKYKEKLKELEKKEPKPGDASKSKDDLDKAW